MTPPFTDDELDAVWDLFDGEVTRLGRPYEDLERLLFHERPLRSPDL